MKADSGRSEFSDALCRELSRLELEPLSEEQNDQLYLHYRLLSKWNRALNLTRITKLHDVVSLQYVECLFAASLIDDATNLLNIGNGAGFPAIPFAVARPSLAVTALEANQKKVVFLE